MLIKDLIVKLQQIMEFEKANGWTEAAGESEIHIDVFKEIPNTCYSYRYAGISPDIRITKTGDGVYNVLTAFASEDK